VYLHINIYISIIIMSLTIYQPLNNSLTEFTNETNSLSDNSRPTEYIKKAALVTQKINELTEYIKELKLLDMDFQQHIKNDSPQDDIIDSNDFSSKLNSIDDNRLIIYVKKAQLYRNYKPEHLNDFRNHNNTVYKYNGPVYEVARDTHCQKLMIVLMDEENGNLDTMQKYIIEFLKQYPNLAKINDSDIVIFKNGPNIEFIVNSISLQNITEQQDFIDEFIIFMYKKGEHDIASKIQLRPPPSGIRGVKFYEIPSNKQQIGGPTIDILNQLVTNVANNNVPIVNVVVNNYVQNNINNSVNTTNINPPIEKKTISTFCKYIYDTKPTWYTENKLVNIEIIEDAYRVFFDDQTTSRANVSRLLKGKIFNISNRNKGVTMKKLLPFNVLKKNF